ncbi:MAG: hypothetical protein ACRD2C_27075 [Acidimicrobiales bacterium]
MALPDGVGRYRVRQLIGAGGFATVYRAVDARLGVEEGRRLRRAFGPHLLAVHDIGETERRMGLRSV